jgi:hypothetical protein
MVSHLQTDFTWSPAELENIFLGSPSKAMSSKEIAFGIDPELNMNNLDKNGLAEVVNSVKANMSNEEKRMTVEQWVRWNARKGEEKLKSECETMVTIFEREGAKAQRALEGIQCAR